MPLNLQNCEAKDLLFLFYKIASLRYIVIATQNTIRQKASFSSSSLFFLSSFFLLLLHHFLLSLRIFILICFFRITVHIENAGQKLLLILGSSIAHWRHSLMLGHVTKLWRIRNKVAPCCSHSFIKSWFYIIE
jgi:hypothetical protein